MHMYGSYGHAIQHGRIAFRVKMAFDPVTPNKDRSQIVI